MSDWPPDVDGSVPIVCETSHTEEVSLKSGSSSSSTLHSKRSSRGHIEERKDFAREVQLHECTVYGDDYSHDVLEMPTHTHIEAEQLASGFDRDDDLHTLNAQLKCEHKCASKLKIWLRKVDILASARLDRTKCFNYLMDALECPLHSCYTSQDASRPWIAYWVLNSLSVLGTDALTPVLRNAKLRNAIITFLSEKCQVPRGGTLAGLKPAAASTVAAAVTEETATEKVAADLCDFGGGFGGGPMQYAHLATSFGAVMALVTLGTDDALQSIDRLGLYHFLVRNQHSSGDGSYTIHVDGEIDIRAVYCGFAAAYVLRLNTAASGERPLTDKRTYDWLKRCIRPDGGFSQEPCDEAHGGYTYCGLASIVIMQRCFLEDYYFESQRRSEAEPSDEENEIICDDCDFAIDLKYFLNVCELERLHRWAAMRQMSFSGGFQGRTDKLVDACYSFWVGALFPLIKRALAQFREALAIVHYATSDDETKTSDVLHSADSCELVDVFSDATLLEDDATDAVEVECDVRKVDATTEAVTVVFREDLISFEPFQLQKYLLIVAQYPSGGICDKPFKPADYYHTCYGLSGLSIAQMQGLAPKKRFLDLDATDSIAEESEEFGTAPKRETVVLGPKYNLLSELDPLFGVTVDKLQYALDYFKKKPSIAELQRAALSDA